MSVETAADRGQPINPMQLSEMPNAKLSGLFTSGYLHQRCVHPVFFSIKQKWGGALVKIDQCCGVLENGVNACWSKPGTLLACPEIKN